MLASLQSLVNLPPSLDHDKNTIKLATFQDRARSREAWLKIANLLVEILKESPARASLISTLSAIHSKPSPAEMKKVILIAILLDIHANTRVLVPAVRAVPGTNTCTDSYIYIVEADGTSTSYHIPNSKKECLAIYDQHRNLILQHFRFKSKKEFPLLYDDESVGYYLLSCKECADESTKKEEESANKKNALRGRSKIDKTHSTEQFQTFLHFDEDCADGYEYGNVLDNDVVEERRAIYLESIKHHKESPDDTTRLYLFTVKFDNWNKKVLYQKCFEIQLHPCQARYYLLLSSMIRPGGLPQLVINPIQKFGEKTLKVFLESTLQFTCLNTMSKNLVTLETADQKAQRDKLIKEGVDLADGIPLSFPLLTTVFQSICIYSLLLSVSFPWSPRLEKSLKLCPLPALPHSHLDFLPSLLMSRPNR